MAHCININSPEYISLARSSKLGQRELKARIATWQELTNNYDRFPSIEEVEGLLDSYYSEVTEEFKEDKYLKEIFPNIDNSSLKEAVLNIRNNNYSDSLISLGNSLNRLDTGSSIQDSYAKDFQYAFNALTSEFEKNSIFKTFAKKGRFFQDLSELYDNYITYSESYKKSLNSDLSKVFDRMSNLKSAINDKGSLLINYLRNTGTTSLNKYYNDNRVYTKETNRRIGIKHEGKSPIQIENSIKEVIQKLKRSYSNKVQIKVSNPKESKNGLFTYVYVIKPRLEDYNDSISNKVFNKEALDILTENKNKFFEITDKESSITPKVTTVKKLLEKFEGNVAKSLLKYIPKEDIIVNYTGDLFLDNKTLENGNFSWTEARYYHNSNTIDVSLSGMYPQTIIHEIVHALTINFIKENRDSKNVKELESLYKYAKDKLKDEDWYGTTNLYEFAAESLSRKSFKDRLKSIEPLKSEKKNLFQQIIDKILDFFGLKKKSKDSLYQQAFSTTANLIVDNYEYITTRDQLLRDRIDSITELDEFNSIFSDSISTIKPEDSPYTASLKRLNSKYSFQEIKDLSSNITSTFTDLISYYQEENPELLREEVISKITPQKLFEETREQFEIDLEEYIENNVNQKYIDNLQKMLDNFSDLAMMATPEINFIEGLKFNQNDLETYIYDEKQELDNGVSQSGDLSNEVDFHENTILDSWQRNFKFTSVNDSLTNKVKRILRSIDELDKKGNPVIDSIGHPRKLNLDIIKNDLLKNMQGVITSKDMLPTLGIMAKQKPWVNSIIKYLQEDNELSSQFYSVFKKDFTKHGITTTVQSSDGVISYKTHIINQSNNLSTWIDNWKSNLENRIIFNSNYSVYDTDGSLNTKNIENNISILQDLVKEWNGIVKQNNIDLRKDFLLRKNITIKNQLNAIGISVDNNEVKNLFLDSLVDTKELKDKFKIDKSSFNLDTILNKLVLTNTWAKSNSNKEGINSLSLIQENKSNYNSIASIIADNLDDLIEGSVHENGKSYYTYLQPSYLSKLTKQLKNIKGSSKEFNDFIDTQFKQYIGTIYNEESNRYNISWLNELTDKRIGSSKRDLFDHKVILNFNKTEYSALSPIEYQNMLLVEYFANKDVAWYHVPILAEAPSAEFIKFDKITLNFKDNIADKLLDLFTYEYNRIKLVRARKEGIKNGNIKSINNFDKNGEKFHFLSFLNEHLSTIDSIVNKEGRLKDVLPTELFDFVKEVIKYNLDIKADKSINYMNSIGLLEKTNNNKYVYLDSLGINQNNLHNKLEEYFYNSYFATANIIQLTSTDLAYYKNVEDFQKRNKEIHAPGTMVNTQAMYNGERVGKDKESYIILSDYEQESTKEVLNYIERVLTNNNLLSEIEKKNILSKYYANNVTDAQAYRSLDSAKTVIAMSTGWNDKLENSYQRLKKGEWDISDYNNIMQAFKPFVYTQTTVDSGILLDPNDPSKGNRMIKVPMQHKNSESILLPMLDKQFRSTKLGGIIKAMQDNNIDVIMFESAVKVGLQGVLDINNLNSREDIANYISSFKGDNQVFKTISYEDYKIQQPIPEHLQDTSQLFGTQLRKLIVSDIAEDAVFKVRGKNFTKKELLSLYNNAIIENTIEAFNGIKNEFKDSKSLQAIIENELINNSRYSKDLLNACQLDTNGNFILPLFDPSQSNRIQQLLNSIWKSRITKQKIKGGKAVQMSSYGFSDDLHLKFKEVDGKVSIDYMECYLPFWSEKMPNNWNLNGFIDPKTGIMDINKMLSEGIIDEEFLEAISYRIPTEDKYSIWPLKVKGFLPRNSGGNIVLPREITTITGSDFDIDSMYMILKEFTFNEKIGKFETIKPDINKDVSEMNTQERNNLLIDVMRTILRHPDTAIKQLNPGNFDGPKMTARRLNILASNTEYTWKQLESMSLEELDKLSSKDQMDILDFTTQVKLHKQNMTAAKLIGIIANHSTNHAIRQNTNIEINYKTEFKKDPENKEEKVEIKNPRFYLNKKFYTSLHDIYSPDNNSYISKNFASFLAASVDAVKDPVLSFFNLNTFTADSAMLLTGLGYNFNEIGLLLRQPSIEELVDYYERNYKYSKTKGTAINDLLFKYKKVLKETLNSNLDPELDLNLFDLDSMAEQIKLNSVIKKFNNLENEDLDKFISINKKDLEKFYVYQYQVLSNYKNILEVAQHLAEFVSSSRSDTGSGGAGPTIADTKFKMRKILKNKANADPIKGEPLLKGIDIIEFVDKETLNTNDKLRNYLRKSPLGFIQSFTTLGLQATEDNLSKYFPHYNKYFDYIFNTMEDYYLKSNKLSVELMNKIYSEFITYYMSQYEEFSNKNSEKFIKDFPNKFLEIKNKDEDLASLQLIKNINYIKPSSEVPYAKLKFISGGRLSSNVRDTMITEWESLLYKPEYRDLAINLFKYNYYLNGFNFGTSSFIHLAPTALKLNIPNFVNNLNKLMQNQDANLNNNQFTEDQLNIFIDQFYRNNLSNKKLVPEIEGYDENSFLDNKSNILDTTSMTGYIQEFKDIFTNNGNILKYITMKIKGNNEYFKITNSELDKNDKISLTFEHIKPLGIKNNFLEYDFNNSSLNSSLLEDTSNASDREEYRSFNPDIAVDIESYEYESSPDPFNIQQYPNELQDQFDNAFNFIQQENEFFDSKNYEALNNDNYYEVLSSANQENNNLNSLIQEVSKEEIDKYKKNCN